MDGSGGFWDWSEELRFLQNAEAARHIILEKSSGSAQNVASDSVQIDHCEEKDCVLIDLTSDHSCLRSKDSHLANESVGPLAPVLFKQSEAFHPVDDSSIDEAHGLSSDTVSIAVPDSSYSDLATDGQREPAHDEATFGDLGQYIGCGGAEQEEDFSCPSEPSPCPSEPSSTGSSEPNERVHNHPQLTTDRQEDGVCWDDGVSGDYGVCADASVCGGSADQESEAQSQNLSALDDIRVRLAFDCLEGDGGKNDVSEDDARTLRPVADCLESANAARGKIFVLPFPLSLPLSIPLLPLRAVGLLAHPLRHVPKIALILLSSAPASRPQQVESRADPSTPPKVNRRKRRSSRGTKSRHFTRKHSLLDLTDPHWLRDDRAPSPGSSMAECAQQMSSENSSSSLDAQEQSEQLYEAGGSEEPRTGGALGGDPVTSAHGLLVSADTSADASNSPHRKTERSRPPQLEISEVTPLTSVHSQRWESDSFALQYSPSSLSLDGGFGYRGVDGGADVSPMSSRSSSSSSLGEPEMQSETGSSTDESDR